MEAKPATSAPAVETPIEASAETLADRPVRLLHDALIYGSDDEFVAAVVPFLRAGLTRGDAAIAAVTRPNLGLLRDALGADAHAVTLIDRDEWYRRPARTIAGWVRLLNEATARGHEHVRIIGEVAFGARDLHPTWTRYESALNNVFADVPAWIICPYDTRVLPAGVLADARRTHPTVANPARRESDDYQAPEDLLRGLREPDPPVDGPPAMKLMDVDNVTAVRHAVADAAVRAGWVSADRLDDLLFALTEIVGNGLRHGAGRRDVRVWTPPWGVVCEVTDEGPGPADPLVGYRPPDIVQIGGRGLWITQQMCDAMAISHAGGRTRVRFAIRSTWQAPAQPSPAQSPPAQSPRAQSSPTEWQPA